MKTLLPSLFLFGIFQVSNGNVMETRLELLEKQMKEVLEREAHTKRENEELQATVASQQSIIVELQATVNEQSDRIEALESERVDSEQGGAFQDSTQMHDTPKSDVINGGKYARSGIISRRQPPEMMVAFSAVKVAIQSSIGLNQNIIFENVILNQGNGFHSQHGVFIAPQTGIYMIVASLLHDGHTPVT
ncbi:uncharacterized protein LOC128210218 [Mya arenaria]|uniref:uncharacterized protein LOC128210218 n=1 Tax=Mya arenaria TaxID=6604 RepID=UPI0022E77DE5|nr:uncharacterized protein LOC128210218 [Mya arenaria]